MTARTAVTVTDLVRDGSAAPSVNDAVAAGNYVECQTSSGGGIPAEAQAMIRKLFITVDNAGTAAVTATVRASGNGVDTGGNTQPAPEPWNTVFTQSTVGDLAVTVAAGATEAIGPFTSDRFEQPDGNLYIDWSSATDVTFTVYQLPFNVI